MVEPKRFFLFSYILCTYFLVFGESGWLVQRNLFTYGLRKTRRDYVEDRADRTTSPYLAILTPYP